MILKRIAFNDETGTNEFWVSKNGERHSPPAYKPEPGQRRIKYRILWTNYYKVSDYKAADTSRKNQAICENCAFVHLHDNRLECVIDHPHGYGTPTKLDLHCGKFIWEDEFNIQFDRGLTRDGVFMNRAPLPPEDEVEIEPAEEFESSFTYDGDAAPAATLNERYARKQKA